MTAFARERWMPEEQTIAKIRSRLYPTSLRGFDLHLYPVGGPDSESETGWHWSFPVACMTPRSRGAVHDAQVPRRRDAALTRPRT